MLLEIRVVPNARKKQISYDGRELKVKLVSQPRDGKANEELVDYLSEVFGIRKARIRIVRGEKDRKKVVAMEDSEEGIMKRLTAMESHA